MCCCAVSQKEYYLSLSQSQDEQLAWSRYMSGHWKVSYSNIPQGSQEKLREAKYAVTLEHEQHSIPIQSGHPGQIETPSKALLREVGHHPIYPYCTKAPPGPSYSSSLQSPLFPFLFCQYPSLILAQMPAIPCLCPTEPS